MVLGGGQLFLEFQNTGIRSGLGTGFFNIKVFFVQLFVSHGVSPAQFVDCEPGSPWLSLYGAGKTSFKGQAGFQAQPESAKRHWQAWKKYCINNQT